MPSRILQGQAFTEYFRCPADAAAFETALPPDAGEGYFSFGAATCYGRSAAAQPAGSPSQPLQDLWPATAGGNGRLRLPFDLDDVARKLRGEQYPQPAPGVLGRVGSADAVRQAYYAVRPALPVAVRKHLQRAHLAGWEGIAFPRWPVDVSVDLLMRETMRLLLQRGGAVPFIWFWPHGAQSCAIVTHDIESRAGRDFCDALADLDDAFGIKSSFQVVPEGNEETLHGLFNRLRSRGFEANLHDLNHDGHLFRDRPQFLARARRINAYARAYGCGGFRSAAMYREQAWFDAFEFRYDMSVPNVAHLEPQRGGCCTVMPYFIGRILELPLTTVQDYSLFHILGDYSTALWKQQIDLITENHGLITILTHPDYLLEPRGRNVYTDLLRHVRAIHRRRGIWMTLPAQVDRWWRNRSQMTLVRSGAGWRVEGPDSDRARVAWATLRDNRVTYTLDAPHARVAERSYA